MTVRDLGDGVAGGASLRKDDAPPPFARLLIANRGEIAVRIIRACRDLGISPVAVYSDADEDAVHVRLADAAIRIGPPAAAESYLRADAIVAAALETGASAVHPGYGFLSERASFAEAVVAAGLTWIGPDGGTIARVGDKLAARRLAAAVDVPVVPGTLHPASIGTDELKTIMAEAADIGTPLLVKAAAGGGGRGMRRVARLDDLPAALADGSAEALAAFGDGSVYLEREIRPARHVEVQLLGERSGRIVALGERDCSLQRRHQKLIEEAPAPGLEVAARRDLHAMAVRVATAAGLENAATAEFLLEPDGRVWFLEVNTRLQVEHGVTELVTDVDLVAEQIRIAAGHPMSTAVEAAAARAAAPERHAIEVRLSAEDPARAFAPAPGRIGQWSMPTGPGVRVDAGVQSGDLVSPEYDPLIAKLLVVGADRDQAIARLRRSLAEVVVTGIQTTLPFHHFVSRHPGFAAAKLSTDWVGDEWSPAESRAAAYRTAAEVAARATVLASGSDAGQVSVRKDTDQERWSRAARDRAVDRWPDR